MARRSPLHERHDSRCRCLRDQGASEIRDKRSIVCGLVAAALAATSASLTPATAKEPPRTGFEERNGESWTTHEEELEFIAEVDELSERVAVEQIGKTLEGRPLHLVKLGYPRPSSQRAAANGQTVLLVCSQHGNEPAGREACLQLLRDLAFTSDKTLLDQLQRQTILFVPSANPDGRAADTRENSQGIDVNRDHLNLQTNEAQAVAEVVRDWRPDLSVDHHEYGPSLPPVYDDELLYLWPRNLNVDKEIHDLAHEFANEWVEPQAEEAGFSADEYGQYEVANQDIHQSAGDEDEGIMRNTMGLRHSLGILIESAVSNDPRNGPGEVTTQAEVNLRRVKSHSVVMDIALEFMRERGDAVDAATEAAPARKTAEGRERSAPVYFYGADNDEPAEDEMQDPPPCGYTLTAKQAGDLNTVFRLHGIKSKRNSGDVYVSMAQPTEPVIPLLLDERGRRHAVAAEPVAEC